MDMKVSLDEELVGFIRQQVAEGHYQSSDEVISEALRWMEAVERTETARLDLLRRAWQAGVDSPDAGELDFAALKKEARISHRRS